MVTTPCKVPVTLQIHFPIQYVSSPTGCNSTLSLIKTNTMLIPALRRSCHRRCQHSRRLACKKPNRLVVGTWPERTGESSLICLHWQIALRRYTKPILTFLQRSRRRLSRTEVFHATTMYIRTGLTVCSTRIWFRYRIHGLCTIKQKGMTQHCSLEGIQCWSSWIPSICFHGRKLAPSLPSEVTGASPPWMIERGPSGLL